jgi:hypothetical protein
MILFTLIHQIYGSSYTVHMNDVDPNYLRESKTISTFPIRTLSSDIWNNQLFIPGTLDLSLSFNVTKNLSNNTQLNKS